MKYEVLSTYEPTSKSGNAMIWPGTPLEIRIHPEGVEAKKMFLALLETAYEITTFPRIGLGGLEPKKAEKYIQFDSKRTLVDKILRKPDTRKAIGLQADYVNGYPVKLRISEDEKVPGTYCMNAHVFARDVAPVKTLFELAQEKLKK